MSNDKFISDLENKSKAIWKVIKQEGNSKRENITLNCDNKRIIDPQQIANFFRQCMVFLDKNKILDDAQEGFWKNKSTTKAIYNFLQNAVEALDNKENPADIFLDLSKTLDILDHRILLVELQKYGIRGTALK
ncbi:uncharacterized protein LOC126285241 [Schistocerca gregaria]|uniref:uncharacterized protein LOC126285241 n=1 Tax=Schistocerca gregaria TaxID=7010 RepID=UPI00211E3F89|nr:uncharacterized protein LOC126285241 [Schistocerca gregaria]